MGDRTPGRRPRIMSVRVLPWVLSIALSVSPALAQSAAPLNPKTVLRDREQRLLAARARVLREPDSAPDARQMTMRRPMPTGGTATTALLPRLSRTAQTPAPGKRDKGILIAILAGAGAATALALLLRGGDDELEAGPVATVLTSGAATITPPQNQ